ncbi:MAG TPA: FHA domain-containing protein [Anaerolineales bacterium]|nr:FHA domain-containing protein [Anaerolineales bacterium]
MNCVRCLSTIVPGAKFCGNCGLVVGQLVPTETGEHEPTYIHSRIVLEVLSGPGAGQRFPIGSVARLGRANGNEVQLFDAEISRLHAVIYKYDQGFAIVDQDSINGTYVNDARCTGPTWINPGDRIAIGRSQILVGPVAGVQPDQDGVRKKEAGFSPWLFLGLVGAGGILLLIVAAVLFALFV